MKHERTIEKVRVGSLDVRGIVVPSESISRARFIALSAAAVLSTTAGVGLQRTVAGATPMGDPIDLTTLGMGTDKNGVENRRAFVEALRYNNRRYYMPPGRYLMDNSHEAPGNGANPNGVINIDGFSGELIMDTDAQIVFLDPTKRGFVFYEGTGAVFRNTNLTFQTMPNRRVVPEECLTFDNHTGLQVLNPIVNGSAAAGILLFRCTDPLVTGARITNTMADGLHFANCQNPRAEGLRTNNTGDDALAFINYADAPAYTGGYARDIDVSDSKARGICVGGQSGVTIEDFQVDGTNASGLLVCRDAFFDTRVPDNVIVRRGTIRNAGSVVDPAGKTGNKFGIEADGFDNVSLSSITVISSRNRGLSSFGRRNVGGRVTRGALQLRGIKLDVPQSDGFNIQDSLPDMAGCTAAGSYGPGFYFGRCPEVRYSGTLSAVRTSQRRTERRAFWFENNGYVRGAEGILDIVDGRSADAVTGYVLFTSGDGGGNLGRYRDLLTHRAVKVENNSRLTLGRV